MNALISEYSTPYSQQKAAVQNWQMQQGYPVCAQQPQQTAQPTACAQQQAMPAPETVYAQQAPAAQSMQYLNGFLSTQIGSRVKVEFLVGTNTYLDKSGKLLEVGANYIILQEAMTDDLLVCDFFNIKFVTIFR